MKTGNEEGLPGAGFRVYLLSAGCVVIPVHLGKAGDDLLRFPGGVSPVAEWVVLRNHGNVHPSAGCGQRRAQRNQRDQKNQSGSQNSVSRWVTQGKILQPGMSRMRIFLSS